MNRFLYFFVLLILSALTSNSQIIRIDTVKNTYVYNKPKNKSTGQTEYMYTVGLKLLSIDQLPKILNQTNSSDYIGSSLYGLMLKINDNQISYRFSGNLYLNDDFSFKNECADCETVRGDLNDLSIKIGFEKNLNYSVIQPYFGFDLGFKKNKFEGTSTNASTVDFTADYDVIAEKTGGVLSPVIGIKFNVIQHLTIGIESGVDAFYNYERQEKTYRDAQRTRTFNKNNKLELLVKPVSFLSLQYNFAHSN